MMDDTLSRIWQEIVARPDGPLAMRFYLQPIMSIIFAIKDGLKDARVGGPPYFWALFTQPAHRAELLRDGWKSVGKIFILAIVLDLLYQFIVLRGLRPLQGLIIAIVIALVPYLLARGLVNRLASRLQKGPSASASQHRL
jgi:hypothetical protein